MISSNNFNCLKIDSNDRRFMVQECNNKYKKKNEYFERLATLLREEEQEILYNYLRCYEIKNKYLSDFPNTEARKKIIKRNLSIEDKFILKYLDDLSIEKYSLGEIRDLYTSYLSEEHQKKYVPSIFSEMIEDKFETKGRAHVIINNKRTTKIFYRLNDNIIKDISEYKKKSIDNIDNDF